MKLTRVATAAGPSRRRVSLVEGVDADFSDIDLHTSSTVHDHLQIESSIDMDLKPMEGERQRLYDVDMFVFIPASVGVNKTTYPKDSFYRDLTNHLRIRTPAFRQWTEGKPADLRLPCFDRYLEVHLSSARRKKLSQSVVAEVKFFGCFVNTALKHMLGQARKGPIDAEVHRIAAIVARFRERYVDRIRTDPLLLDGEVRSAFLLIDEYISYRFEEILICVADASAEFLKDEVVELLKKESHYRKARGLLVLEEGDNHRELLEGYGHRLSLLKKFVSQILYLQVKLIQREKIYRNIMGAVGAGLAGLWALLVDVGKVHGHGQDSIWHVMFMSVAVIMVYVFKDRIKDVSKEYLNDRLKHRLPDLQTVLSYSWSGSEGKERKAIVGAYDESVRYVSSGELPPDVGYVRNIAKRNHIEPTRHEAIIHYCKRVTFDLEKVLELSDDLHFVRNILRFSFAHFLEKLDDPDKDVHYFDVHRGLCVARAPKVYHVNVVFRYTVTITVPNRPPRRRVEYEKVRVVLDKQGVVRVEEVVPRGRLGYEELVA